MPRRINTGVQAVTYIIVSSHPNGKENDWIYGYVNEKRFAVDIVKQLNARGEINGEIFNYRELKQMMPVNYYIEADLVWLKPAEK